ncbi:MAG TPA: hypothetical protein VHX20_18030 [Terracidiphilus sp.]|jgi:hypothetical protein|nr:hypothetical protein [Terracidiphilus sp.]
MAIPTLSQIQNRLFLRDAATTPSMPALPAGLHCLLLDLYAGDGDSVPKAAQGTGERWDAYGNIG